MRVYRIEFRYFANRAWHAWRFHSTLFDDRSSALQAAFNLLRSRGGEPVEVEGLVRWSHEARVVAFDATRAE